MPLSYWSSAGVRRADGSAPGSRAALIDIVLHARTYTESELLTVLRLRGADASLVLAHQLVAAKLNIANGSDSTTIATTVADTDRLLALFGDKLPYGVRRSSVLGHSMVGDGQLLRRYNSGRKTPTCVRSLR